MSALILNPNARCLRRSPQLLARLEAVATRHARVFLTGDLGELDSACARLEQAKASRVIVCGGDGSYMAATTALHKAFGAERLPELVFLPAGTMATVARNWRDPGAPRRARIALPSVLPRLLDPSSKLEFRARPTLQIDDAAGAQRIGFIFGSGLVARFFDRYYAAGAAGARTAVGIAVPTFFGSLLGGARARALLAPLPCRLRVDGGPELSDDAYSLVVASVVKNLGLHFLVTYRAGEDPKRIHLVASSLGPRQLGPQALRVIGGKPLQGPGIVDQLLPSFRLSFPDGPGPYVLDGDVFRATEVRVRAGPMIRAYCL